MPVALMYERRLVEAKTKLSELSKIAQYLKIIFYELLCE
jgi:hypothetical protein